MSFQNQPDPATPPATTDTNSAFLIVGDRAFRTQEDLTKHVEHSQSHIKTLEEEHAGYKARIAELEAVAEKSAGTDASAEKILEMLNSMQQSKDEPKPAPTGGVSKEDLDAVRTEAAKLAIEQMNENASAAQQQANLDTCLDKAKEVFGDSMGEQIGKTATDLNMSMADVDALAKSNPIMFDRLFLPSKSSTTSFSGGGVNTNTVVRDNTQQVSKPEKTVMSGATTSDIRNMWDYCKPENFNKD